MQLRYVLTSHMHRVHSVEADANDSVASLLARIQTQQQQPRTQVPLYRAQRDGDRNAPWLDVDGGDYTAQDHQEFAAAFCVEAARLDPRQRVGDAFSTEPPHERAVHVIVDDLGAAVVARAETLAPHATNPEQQTKTRPVTNAWSDCLNWFHIVYVIVVAIELALAGTVWTAMFPNDDQPYSAAHLSPSKPLTSQRSDVRCGLLRTTFLLLVLVVIVFGKLQHAYANNAPQQDIARIRDLFMFAVNQARLCGAIAFVLMAGTASSGSS